MILAGASLPSVAQEALSEATRRLFDAISKNDLAETQASIALGADVFARNDRGQTPTELAVDQGRFEIAHYLLSVRNVMRAIAQAPVAPTPALPGQPDQIATLTEPETPGEAMSVPTPPEPAPSRSALPMPPPVKAQPAAPVVEIAEDKTAPTPSVPDTVAPVAAAEPTVEIAQKAEATPDTTEAPPAIVPDLALPAPVALVPSPSPEPTSSPAAESVEQPQVASLPPPPPPAPAVVDTPAVSPKASAAAPSDKGLLGKLADIFKPAAKTPPSQSVPLPRAADQPPSTATEGEPVASTVEPTVAAAQTPSAEEPAAEQSDDYVNRMLGLLDAKGETPETSVAANLPDNLDQRAEEAAKRATELNEAEQRAQKAEPSNSAAAMAPLDLTPVETPFNTSPQIAALPVDPVPSTTEVPAALVEPKPIDINEALQALATISDEDSVPKPEGVSPAAATPPAEVDSSPSLADRLASTADSVKQKLLELIATTSTKAQTEPVVVAQAEAPPAKEAPAVKKVAADNGSWSDRLAVMTSSALQRITGIKSKSAVAPKPDAPEADQDSEYLARVGDILDDKIVTPATAAIDPTAGLGLAQAPTKALPATTPLAAAEVESDDYLDRLNKILDAGATPAKPAAPVQAVTPPALSTPAPIARAAPLAPQPAERLMPTPDPSAPPNPLAFAQRPEGSEGEKPRPAARPVTPTPPKEIAVAPVPKPNSPPEDVAAFDVFTPLPTPPAPATTSPRPAPPEKGTTQVASLTPDADGWAVKEVQIAKVAPALPKQNVRVLAPQDYLKGVALTLGKNVRIGKAPENRETVPGERPGCLYKSSSMMFCIEQVDWAPELKPAFEVSTIMYIGQRAIVRYDDNKATSIFSLYNSSSFEVVAKAMRERYGDPTETLKRVIAPLAQPRLTNTTMIWRSVDPTTNMITNMELRQFDDARGGFPDIRHGVVLLQQAWVPPIFPMLSQIELMRIVK